MDSKIEDDEVGTATEEVLKASAQVYTVEGRESLTHGDWGPTNAASRFFRVKVGMP